MNIKEFLKDYSSGKSIDMFSEEFINISNKMQETEKLLWQYNNTFQSYKNNKDILNKIFETNIDESVIIMQNFHVDIGNILDPINTSAADVTFKFTNFGECEELMGNGSYTMLGAKVKGEGKGVEGTITVTSTMYPAVVDFNSLNTINKQFVGNYKLNQNGRGNVDVEATAN